jgi:MFS family permease
MLACGLPGLLLAPFIFALREPPRAYATAQHASLAGWTEVRAFYRRNADTILLHHAGFLLLALMGFGIVFWAVTCLTRVHGMSPPDAARAFGWVYLLSGTPGSLSAPLLAARFARRGRGDANVVAAMFGATGAVMAIAASQLMPNAFWTLVCFAPAMFFVTSPFGLAYGSLPVITPPAMRAVVASVFMFVVNLGLLLGPPLAGFLNEVVFRGASGIRWSLLMLTLVCGGAGLALLSLARRPYARSLADADALAAVVPGRLR